MNLRKELASAIHHENFDVTAEGIFFPKQGVMASGEYFDRINGGEWERTPNLVVTEGLALILSVAFGSTAKPAGHYLALFSGAAAPAANWTAASFAAAASEIVSMTEGYTSPTRPVWTPPASTATGSIDNMAAIADDGQRLARPRSSVDALPLVAQCSEGVPVQRALPQVAVRHGRHKAPAGAQLQLSGRGDVHVCGVPNEQPGAVSGALQCRVLGGGVDACQRHQGNVGHQKAPLRYWSELPSGRMK